MPRRLHDAIIYIIKVLFNSILLASAIIVALALRFDLQPNTVPNIFIEILAEQIIFYVLFNFVLFLYFSQYENLIETIGVNDLAKIVFATGASSLALYLVGMLMGRTLPRSVYILTWLLSVVFVGGYMLFLRIAISAFKSHSRGIKNEDRIMLVGANDNTVIVINYLNTGVNMGKAVVIIDHEGAKVGKRIKNIKVAGMIPEIPQIVQKYSINSIILCFDETQNSLKSETIKICLETGSKLKSFSAPQESLQPGAHIGRQRFRKIEYSDLLVRSEVKLDTSVCSYVQDKTVLITGGGGSIGSELCRQV